MDPLPPRNSAGGWGRRPCREGWARRRPAATTPRSRSSPRCRCTSAGSGGTPATRRPRTRRGTARAAASSRRRPRRGKAPSPRPRPRPGGPWSGGRRRPPVGTTPRHPPSFNLGMGADVAHDRRLQPAEREVETVVEHRPGNAIAVGSPLIAIAIDRGPARIAEAEEPRDLVERLAGRVVDRLTEQPVLARGPASRRASCAHPTRAAPPPGARARAPRAAPRTGGPRGG